jgi:hypothetical protein
MDQAISRYVDAQQVTKKLFIQKQAVADCNVF